MIARTLHPLVQLRPRDDIIYVSQNRTVLATELNGFITEGPERGLFFHHTRLLSRYCYLIIEEIAERRICTAVSLSKSTNPIPSLCGSAVPSDSKSSWSRTLSGVRVSTSFLFLKAKRCRRF